MDSFKSILFIGSYPNAIDKTRNCFFQNLIHAIAELGIKCTVISPVSITHYKKEIYKIPTYIKEHTENGNEICVFYPKYISFSAKQIGEIKTGRLTEKCFQLTVKKTIERLSLHFDAVYGHFFLGGGLAAATIGYFYNVPAFIAFGEDNYYECIERPYGKLSEKEIKGLSGIISVSSYNKSILIQNSIFKDIPILVAPNGVSKEIVPIKDKAYCRKELGIPEGKFVVGFIGAFCERKGDLRLYEAVNGLDEVYVAFAGYGKRHEGKNVVFSQPLRRKQVPVFLSAINVFVLPTLSEGCCNAIVEALACGVPVISSNRPFNDDILNCSNSIRVDPMNIEMIRDAICVLKENPQMVEHLSNGALKSAEQLSITKRAEHIIEFMEKCRA